MRTAAIVCIATLLTFDAIADGSKGIQAPQIDLQNTVPELDQQVAIYPVLAGRSRPYRRHR